MWAYIGSKEGGEGDLIRFFLKKWRQNLEIWRILCTFANGDSDYWIR